jgi:uncharacterized membrane protein YedE/YeeE
MNNFLFPSGWVQFLIGGLLIGFGVGFMYLYTGRIVGLSTFFSSSLSWISKLKSLQQPTLVNSRLWRLACAVGLILGAGIWAHYFDPSIYANPNINPIALFTGGVLVGFGSRMSNGCTSGHGICGLSSLSLPSLVAVFTFMTCAITTAITISFIFGGRL